VKRKRKDLVAGRRAFGRWWEICNIKHYYGIWNIPTTNYYVLHST